MIGFEIVKIKSLTRLFVSSCVCVCIWLGRFTAELGRSAYKLGCQWRLGGLEPAVFDFNGRAKAGAPGALGESACARRRWVA